MLRLVLLVAALSVLSLAPLAYASGATATSASSGYVVYNVQATLNGTSRAASVNESVTPTSKPGESVVLIAVEGAESNFTYSRTVNSSLTLFPYLPAISNESYTYSGKHYTVEAKISEQGTSQATFQGKSYTLTDYAFSAEVSSTNGSRTISGSLSAFPSDLVYSVTAQGKSDSATATLTATSLELDSASMSPAVQATSAGVGLSLAVGAVALSLGVKFRHKPQAVGPKPDHWVD